MSEPRTVGELVNVPKGCRALSELFHKLASMAGPSEQRKLMLQLSDKFHLRRVALMSSHSKKAARALHRRNGTLRFDAEDEDL
jgi:hypothetical protein